MSWFLCVLLLMAIYGTFASLIIGAIAFILNCIVAGVIILLALAHR